MDFFRMCSKRIQIWVGGEEEDSDLYLKKAVMNTSFTASRCTSSVREAAGSGDAGERSLTSSRRGFRRRFLVTSPACSCTGAAGLGDLDGAWMRAHTPRRNGQPWLTSPPPPSRPGRGLASPSEARAWMHAHAISGKQASRAVVVAGHRRRRRCFCVVECEVREGEKCG
jgi:hypothetical protein